MDNIYSPQPTTSQYANPIQNQPPQRQHVAFTQPNTSGRVTFNRGYLLSISGIVRWLLIVNKNIFSYRNLG
jgi:hypothetical protein